MSEKSFLATAGQVPQAWYIVDAKGQVLGRLAVKIARVLMGKHKPEYTPHVDVGDFVIVTNCNQIEVTGDKELNKQYSYYSLYPGGLRHVPLREMRQNNPTEILRRAVKRMLPKNRLSRKRLVKLKLYIGGEHEHQAQKPQPFPF